MRRRRNRPGHRIGSVDILHMVKSRKLAYRQNPKDTKHAGSQERDDHRQNRVSKTSYHSCHGVHDTADKIRSCDEYHSLHSFLHHKGAVRINSKERPSEQAGEISYRNSREHSAGDRTNHYLSYPVVFTRSHILAGKGNCRLIKGVHGKIGKTLDIGRCRASRHDIFSVAVNRRLNNYIRQRKEHPLKSCREPDLQDDFHFLLMDAQKLSLKLESVLFPAEAAQNKKSRKALRNRCSSRNPRNVHVQRNYKKQVEPHVQYP